MAQTAENLLRLLYDAQEYRCRLNVDGLLLHRVDDLLPVFRESLLHALGILPEGNDALLGRFCGGYYLLRLTEDVAYLFLDVGEAVGVFSRERREIVAYMLTAWVVDALEAVEELLHAVVGEEVPCVLLDSEDVVYLPQSDDLTASCPLQLLACRLYAVRRLAQLSVFLVHEGVGDVLIAAGGEGELLVDAVCHVHAEEEPTLVLALCAEELMEEEVALAVCLHALELHVAAYEEDYCHGYGDRHGSEAWRCSRHRRCSIP